MSPEALTTLAKACDMIRDGCWACGGHAQGCTCDVDWGALAEERLNRD